ncbi:YhjD/YihY/BrkB family envelope integrity protein [Nitrospira moscoviensis]|uniref:Ribonuclease BN n=1 Tax=Nitrospira moscoviensis TaxID=42253 RepID=A0A0K2GBS7_NITMO|nr:YhjD/YihY/BrkB family envelope integrity protein [Nitrospira moscoviensis]ALA58401.1 Ribonuclease BN [Nitrospira moscoviensis]
MPTSARIARFLKHDMWTLDLATLPFPRRLGVHALRLAIAVGLEFRHRLLDARAAGLVFTTLLSLVPFLAVMFSALKAFDVHHLIEPFLAQALEPLGAKSVEITHRIVGFVDNLKIGVLGVVGVAGLFYTTYSLVDKIEQALNAIWMVRHGRPWGRKFTDYLSAVLVGPVLVFTALGLLASLQSHTVVQRLMETEPFGTLLLWIAELTPFLLLCGVFTFFYKFIPNTTVFTGSALVGGVSAAVLWGLAGEAFAKFVAASAKYSAIYSSFAVLILFLLWLYAGWLIVLIGAQFSFFHQHPTAYLSRLLWQQGTPAFRERLALTVLQALARRYREGAPPLRPSDLAITLKLPASLVDEQVDRLVDSGLVGVLKEPEGLALIKPPDLISVKEVLDTVRDGHRTDASLPIDLHHPLEALLRRRDDAVARALAGETVQSLLTELPGSGAPRQG